MGTGPRSQQRERVRRLRWRLRGAYQWPLFAAITVADAALLHWLPLAGDGTGWIPALLLAGCLNLIAVAVLGGIVGWLLRRRRPDLPKVVADDYAGSALLIGVAAAFLAIGLVHRPEVASDHAALRAQREAFERWVVNHGDAYSVAHVSLSTTLTLEPTLFRSCAPRRDPRRWLCAIVDTTRDPPRVTPDPNRESNASFNRPGGFR